MSQYLTPPPDYHPRKPKMKVPKGAWDTQIHLFGPASEYAFDPTSPYHSDEVSAESAIAMQDQLGLARSLLVSGGGYGLDYLHMEHTLTKYPDRFRGVIFPSEQTTDQEIERLHAMGVRGIRFVSDRRAVNLPRIQPEVAARVKAFNWPVHFYPHGTDLLEYADALMALDSDRIVLDHLASIPAAGGVNQPAFKKLLEMLDSGRVWVKLSGPMRCTNEEPPYPSVTPIARTLVEHAPERMMWASDWPHVNMVGRTMPNDGDLLDLLAEWAPSEADRLKILVTTPDELYGY
jgi:2-pyrone-4,6-dicarboxylate lactonase